MLLRRCGDLPLTHGSDRSDTSGSATSELCYYGAPVSWPVGSGIGWRFHPSPAIYQKHSEFHICLLAVNASLHGLYLLMVGSGCALATQAKQADRSDSWRAARELQTPQAQDKRDQPIAPLKGR